MSMAIADSFRVYVSMRACKYNDMQTYGSHTIKRTYAHARTHAHA